MPPGLLCKELDAESATCSCRNHWEGPGCLTCPGNWDPNADCSACLNHFEGSDCEICPGNFDAEQACSVCRNRWLGDSCETCPPGWDAEQDCAVCAGNRTIASNCTACIPGFDPLANCEACLPGFDPATNCVECLDGFTRSGNACADFCGNGRVSEIEECDDGNTDPFDGCDACTIVALPLDPTGTDWQTEPDVASAESGAFAVTFSQGQQDSTIHAQKFKADGRPEGAAVQVDPQRAWGPSVFMAPDETFVVAFLDTDHRIRVRRFGSDGNPLADALALTGEGEAPGLPALGGAPDGRFAVSFQRAPSMRVSTFSAAGEHLDDLEYGLVESQQLFVSHVPSVDVDETGGVFVGFIRAVPVTISPGYFEPRVRLLDLPGPSDEFGVQGQSLFNAQTEPKVVMGPGGSRYVIWNLAGTTATLLGQAFEPGATTGPVTTLAELHDASVSTDLVRLSDGRLAVAYRAPDGLELAVWEDRFASQSWTRTVTQGELYGFSLAPSGDGGVLAVWSERRAGAARPALFAQRYGAGGNRVLPGAL